jgi:hypothetical protein
MRALALNQLFGCGDGAGLDALCMTGEAALQGEGVRIRSRRAGDRRVPGSAEFAAATPPNGPINNYAAKSYD